MYICQPSTMLLKLLCIRARPIAATYFRQKDQEEWTENDWYPLFSYHIRYGKIWTIKVESFPRKHSDVEIS